MSSQIVALLVVISCLCMNMYACNAGRVLGFSYEASASHNHASVKEDVVQSSSTRRPSMSPHELKNHEIVIHEKADLSRKEGESTNKPTSSGHDMVTLSTSSQIYQLYQNELKGRSVLGSATQDNDNEEDHITESEGGSTEAAIDEDVGVMDYANPHRKPPIHNEKP